MHHRFVGSTLVVLVMLLKNTHTKNPNNSVSGEGAICSREIREKIESKIPVREKSGNFVWGQKVRKKSVNFIMEK